MIGRGRLWTSAVVVVLALLASLAAPSPAHGQSGDDADDPGTTGDLAEIEISVVGAISWDRGDRVEARVEVQAARAVSGTLAVVDESFGLSTTTFEFDVDLAANTVASYPVTLTTGWEGIQVRAALRVGDELVAVDSIQRFGEGTGGQLVAVLGIDDAPRTVAVVGLEDQLEVLVLDEQLRGLDQSTSLVAEPASLRGLGSDSRSILTLEAWIRGGGQLVVDGPQGALDDRYHRHPTANPDRFSFGAGSIVYAQDWRDGLPLGGYQSQEALRQLLDIQNIGTGASAELGFLAQVSLPAVGLIVAVLLLYSLLAGPLLFIVLGRRRERGRIWVILPAISAVFALAIVTYGWASRSGRTDAHITIVEVNERGSRATTNVLLSSNLGGNRTVETPGGWTYLGQGQGGDNRPVLVRARSSSLELAVDMPAGSHAVTRLAGLAPEFDGLLTIDDIEVADDTVTASVTNHSSNDLTDAVVFLGNARSEVGDIEAGDTVPVEVERHDDSGRTMKELLIWPRVRVEWGLNERVAVPIDGDVSTAAGAWAEWRLEQGTSTSPENVIGVVGWSEGFSSPIAGVDEGRTALFARTNINDEGSQSPVGWSTVVRLADQTNPDGIGDFFGYSEDYRVSFSPGYDLDRLALQLNVNSAGVSFLIDDEWQYIELDQQTTNIEIPADAVVDGEVRFRSHVPEWVWGEGATVQMVADASDVAPATLTDEPQFRFDREFMMEEEFFGGNQPRNMLEESLTDIGPDLEEGTFESEGFIGPQAYHGFTVELVEGDVLIVTLRSINQDAFLELLDPNLDLVDSNDDAFGRCCDSQIQYTIREDGVYEIRAMELGAQPIDYQLTVEVEQ